MSDKNFFDVKFFFQNMIFCQKLPKPHHYEAQNSAFFLRICIIFTNSRLFINGKWEVLKLDYFIPKSYGVRTIYANIIQCQLWVALIEKAFAKVKGNYGNLDEGSCEEAFTYLTGCPCRSQKIDKEMDEVKLWKELMGYQ